jgi:hypothetical protein
MTSAYFRNWRVESWTCIQSLYLVGRAWGWSLGWVSANLKTPSWWSALCCLGWVQSNRTRKQATPPTHANSLPVGVRLYTCILYVPPKQVRIFWQLTTNVHTFLTLHLTLNGWPTLSKQFECGHCGDISTAPKEPVREPLGIIGAHAILSNTQLSGDWVIRTMVVSMPTCQGFMTVCKMMQGCQGVTIPLISE